MGLGLFQGWEPGMLSSCGKAAHADGKIPLPLSSVDQETSTGLRSGLRNMRCIAPVPDCSELNLRKSICDRAQELDGIAEYGSVDRVFRSTGIK